MYGYIPLSLIMAGADPYGPTGLLPGGKPRRPIRLRWLRLFRARRSAPEVAPQAELVSCCSKAQRGKTMYWGAPPAQMPALTDPISRASLPSPSSAQFAAIRRSPVLSLQSLPGGADPAARRPRSRP